MKRLRTILLLMAVFVCATNYTDAQLRKKTTAPIPQGTFLDFGVPANGKDTLAVSDTIAYISNIVHTNKVTPYLNFSWLKIGSGTATLNVAFAQSNDGVTWFPLTAGVTQAAYSKTYTLSASGTNEVSFTRDTVMFDGIYLKMTFKTGSTASVQGSLSGRLKTYWQ